MVILNLMSHLNVSPFGKRAGSASNVFVLMVGIVLALIVAFVLIRPEAGQVRQGIIELKNLRDQYCPLRAAVVVADPNTPNAATLFDSTVVVDECRFITLNNLTGLTDGPHQVYVKLPGALAFRVVIDSTTGSYQFAPSLGDVNEDNIIDTKDESQVAEALFSDKSAEISLNDIDQDKKISVLDLSLTRVNRRAGVARPDGQVWSMF